MTDKKKPLVKAFKRLVNSVKFCKISADCSDISPNNNKIASFEANSKEVTHQFSSVAKFSRFAMQTVRSSNFFSK